MCFGLFIIMLDNTIVNVALPAIQRELDATPAMLEWTINAYVLAFAVLILLGGKLGDRFGRKRMFLVGLVIFIAFSAACALAPTRSAGGVPRRPGRGRRADEPAHPLDPGRGVPPARARHGHRHLGGHLGAGAGDRPAGRRPAGQHVGWAAIFWINVPIGIVGVAVTLSRSPSRATRGR